MTKPQEMLQELVRSLGQLAKSRRNFHALSVLPPCYPGRG
jgi:hypothetical protein